MNHQDSWALSFPLQRNHRAGLIIQPEKEAETLIPRLRHLQDTDVRTDVYRKPAAGYKEGWALERQQEDQPAHRICGYIRVPEQWVCSGNSSRDSFVVAPILQSDTHTWVLEVSHPTWPLNAVMVVHEATANKMAQFTVHFCFDE